MIREVVCNLLRGHVNPIHKFLVMKIALLSGGQNFRHIIYWALNSEGLSFFFPLDRKYCTDNLSRGCNVKSRGSLLIGAASTGWVESRALRSANAASASGVH